MSYHVNVSTARNKGVDKHHCWFNLHL